MVIDFDRFGVQFRVVDGDGLTQEERLSVSSLLEPLGYSSLEEFVSQNGYSSARELARSRNFKSTRDYFLGEGWYDRLAVFDRNGL
jgi:hypothetical protein